MFPIANYTSHQQTLTALLEDSCGKPLLFICGEKDHGKTWLLKWFRAEVNSRCRIVSFDLAARQALLSPSLILRRCSDELGSQHFENFLDQVQVYSRSRSVVIQNVKIEGNNNRVTGDAGETLQEQILVAIDLTRVFVAELKRLAAQRPIIFVFDHVDSAGSLISGWLFEGLIPALRDVPHSRLVLAGRQFPSVEDSSWAATSTSVTLSGVSDATAWSTLMKLLKKRFPSEAGADPNSFLQGAILISKGVPGTIMPFIQTFPAEMQHG
jgi:hypothetical protein